MTTKTDAQPDAAKREENEEAVEATEPTHAASGTAEQPVGTETEATAADDSAEEDAAYEELVAQEEAAAAAARPAGVGQGAGAVV
ncbi:hypothetical protein G3I40_25610, partial [Streptomyces sp. SID14478]|nr:hypothetical protein [Streptomyces sp. SID14478]